MLRYVYNPDHVAKYSRYEVEKLLDELEEEARKEGIDRGYRSGLWYAQNLIEAMIKRRDERGVL